MEQSIAKAESAAVEYDPVSPITVPPDTVDPTTAAVGLKITFTRLVLPLLANEPSTDRQIPFPEEAKAPAGSESTASTVSSPVAPGVIPAPDTCDSPATDAPTPRLIGIATGILP